MASIFIFSWSRLKGTNFLVMISVIRRISDEKTRMSIFFNLFGLQCSLILHYAFSQYNLSKIPFASSGRLLHLVLYTSAKFSIVHKKAKLGRFLALVTFPAKGKEIFSLQRVLSEIRCFESGKNFHLSTLLNSQRFNASFSRFRRIQ